MFLLDNIPRVAADIIELTTKSARALHREKSNIQTLQQIIRVDTSSLCQYR
jgi:hypothetical protein